MAKIYNFIVFGDSMSDIGIKRETYLIRAVRFGQAVLPIASLIRINEIGRFSDRKNWTDFLWEWSGGERSASSICCLQYRSQFRSK
jgi:hypothetical protein